MNGLSLFEITGDYKAAAEKLADLDLDEQTVADTLESLSGELEVKAQAVAAFARNLDVTAEAIKAFEKQQKERREAIERRAERLRAYLAHCLQAAGVKKVSGPGIDIGFRKSTAVVINEPGLLPAEYMRQKPPPAPEPDKVAIGAALKAGTEVPGAHLDTREHLQIR